MRYVETGLDGLWVVELEPNTDERGSFTRTYDHDEFAARGLDPSVRQCSTSFNVRAGTLRGMHFQAAPHEEVKLLRCTRGAVFDVAVDLRPASPTHRRWFGVELSQDNGRQLYIPRGFAHGFQTLVDDAEVLYYMGTDYVPDLARGVRWDDPAFGIEWPEPPAGWRIMSERDANYPDYLP